MAVWLALEIGEPPQPGCPCMLLQKLCVIVCPFECLELSTKTLYVHQLPRLWIFLSSPIQSTILEAAQLYASDLSIPLNGIRYDPPAELRDRFGAVAVH